MTYRVVEVVSLARVTCTFSVAVLHRFSDALLPKWECEWVPLFGE